MSARSATTGLPRAIVFDLDGTLVDSAPDIQLAINAAFMPLGVPEFDLAAIKGLIGGGAPAAVARAAAMAGIELGVAGQKAALDRFYSVYAEASAKGRGLYPGAIELLENLVAAGIPLGLCTNKSHPIAEIALEALGIDRYFESVVGARDDVPKKPDPAMLRAAMAPLGAASSDVVMIGDTAADIGAARAAGVRSIAIGHGYSKVPVAELGADAVVADLSTLHRAIQTLFANPR
jgi:phosphoglycolate phosphatase